MNARRLALGAGSVASAAVLSMSMTTSASAYAFGHAWNYSPSQNECLAIAGNQPFSRTVMWTCDAESGQQWAPVLAPDGQGYFLESSLKDQNGVNQCLDGSQGSGKALYAMECGTATDWNEWYLFKAGATDEWANVADKNQCLAVSGGSTANGAQPILWNCQQSPDELWGGSI